MKEGDTIFRRPLTREQPILPGEEEKGQNVPDQSDPTRNNLMIPPVTSGGKFLLQKFREIAQPNYDNNNFIFSDLLVNAIGETTTDQSHTRTSSTTSQASVGYSSSQNSQPGHSRKSSSGGESSHER